MRIILSDDTGYNGRLQGRVWRVLCVWSHVFTQKVRATTGPLSRSPLSLPWHWRLEARVLLGVPIVAGLALGAVLASTIGVVNNYALDRAREELIAAHGAFDRLVDARTESASRQLRLISEFSAFRSLGAIPADGSVPPPVVNLTESYLPENRRRFLRRDRSARPLARPDCRSTRPGIPLRDIQRDRSAREAAGRPRASSRSPTDWRSWSPRQRDPART